MSECLGGANHPGGVRRNRGMRFPILNGISLDNRLPNPIGKRWQKGPSPSSDLPRAQKRIGPPKSSCLRKVRVSCGPRPGNAEPPQSTTVEDTEKAGQGLHLSGNPKPPSAGRRGEDKAPPCPCADPDKAAYRTKPPTQTL